MRGVVGLELGSLAEAPARRVWGLGSVRRACSPSSSIQSSKSINEDLRPKFGGEGEGDRERSLDEEKGTIVGIDEAPGGRGDSKIEWEGSDLDGVS